MPIPHHILKESSVDRAVDLLLRDALEASASELILEPLSGGGAVRWRRDGLLHEVFRQSKEAHTGFVARLKRLAHLREGAPLAAQEGGLRRVAEGLAAEARLSIVPMSEGEKAVLHMRTARPGFADLGLSKDQAKEVSRILKKTGLLLLAGSRRSGLTTTLYALLEAAEAAGKRVISVEAPVEEEIPGIEQESVRPEQGLVFSALTRDAVARGADVIGLGDFRDEETAAVAVSAAEHRLVIAVIEANGASDAVASLLDLRIEPRRASKILSGVLCQRLERRACPGCGGRKCERCFYTGHRGQEGRFELMDFL